MTIKTSNKKSNCYLKPYIKQQKIISNQRSECQNHHQNHNQSKRKFIKIAKENTVKSDQKIIKQNSFLQTSQKNKKNLNKLQSSNAFTNISVVTQRIRSCSKCCPNYECNKNQQAFSRNSIMTSKSKKCNKKSYSLQKQAKIAPQKQDKNKTDKKSEYMSKKVKQFQGEMSNKKGQKSQTNKHNNSKTKLKEEKEFSKINIDTKMTQFQTFLNQTTQKMLTAKKSENSFILSQMQKAQKNLIDKIQRLQSYNKNLQATNQHKLQQISTDHKIQTSKLKNQINFLSQKVCQQNVQNSKIQERVAVYESSMNELRSQIDNKEQRIKSLKIQNSKLEQQNLKVNKKLQVFEHNMNTLQQNIYSLKNVKQNLQLKLKKMQTQKKYIKQNSEQVLKILREQCKEMFQLQN